DIMGGAQITCKMNIENPGEATPACVAQTVMRFYFDGDPVMAIRNRRRRGSDSSPADSSSEDSHRLPHPLKLSGARPSGTSAGLAAHRSCSGGLFTHAAFSPYPRVPAHGPGWPFSCTVPLVGTA